MARTQFSLKSAHLLMWSSPVLLLVLVFTLTSATTSRTSATTVATTTRTSATTVASTPTLATTTTTEAVTTPPTTGTEIKTTTTIKNSFSVVTTIPTTPSTLPIDNNFSSATKSTAKPVASAPNASAMNGELSGTLGPTLAFADVPLRGPGTWTLTSSASTNQTLRCGSMTSPVTSQVVVGDAQICQLEITSTSGEASTWQLTPAT